MDKDDIIRMAREAGWDINDLIDVFDFGVRLERFAALVAAAERKECAKLCEEEEEIQDHTPCDCAKAIRARGNTHD